MQEFPLSGLRSAREKGWDPTPVFPTMLSPELCLADLRCLAADIAAEVQVDRSFAQGPAPLSLLLPKWRHDPCPSTFTSIVRLVLSECVRKILCVCPSPDLHAPWGDPTWVTAGGGLPLPASYLPAMVALDARVSLWGQREDTERGFPNAKP